MNAEDIVGRIQDTRDLWPHNAFATEDQAVEIAVLKALDARSGDPGGCPLLREEGPPRQIFDVLHLGDSCWSTYDEEAAACNRCRRDDDDHRPRHTLWVKSGASVVDLHVCSPCRAELDLSLVGLVWRAGPDA